MVEEGGTEGPPPRDGGSDDTAITAVRDGEPEDGESLLDRDEAVRDILKGAGVVYGGLVLNMGLAFLAQRFAAVYLSISSFGGLMTGTALLNLGGIIAGLGLSSGLTRYLPRVESEAKRPLVNYALALTLPVGIVLAAVTAVYGDFIAARVFGAPEVAVSVKIFGATIPFAAVLNLAIGGIRGQKISRFRVYVKNLLHPSIRFALIIAAVLLGLDQAGFAAAYAVPFVVAATVATFLFYRTLPDSGDRTSGFTVLPEMIHYSLPFTVSGLASFVYRSIDIFLVLYFIGSTAVGLYGVAYAFARLLAMFSTAFNYLGTPVSSELESNERMDEAIEAQRAISRWVTISSVAVLVPMVLFASDLLGIIYRPNYAEGGLALTILAVGFAAKNVLLTNGPLLKALGLSKLDAFNTTAAAAVNLGLNVLLIPRYGIEGAAVATTVSFLVLGSLPALEVRYHTGSSTISRSVLVPVVLALPLVAAGTLFSWYVPGTLFWIGTFGASFAALYAATVIVLQGLNSTDVMVIRSMEDKYGVDSAVVDAVVRRFS